MGSSTRGDVVAGGLQGWGVNQSSSNGDVGVPNGGQQGLQGWGVQQNTGGPNARWQAGQNMAGTENAFSNPWFAEWLPKYQEAMDNGSAGSYFLNRGSGIAMMDQDGVDNQGAPQRVRIGDMFDNGTKIGNVYDTYGKEQADQLMAPLMLSAQEQQNGVTIDQKHREFQSNWNAAQGQDAFKAEVDQVKKDMGVEGDTDSLFEQLTTGAGIAGGAVTGAGIGAGIGSIVPGLGTLAGGVIGGVAGAITGAFGAQANQDQLEEQWARGEAQARLVERQKNEPGTDAAADARLDGAAASTRLQTWMGAASSAMNPLGQAVQGAAEYAFEGERVGDDESAYYSTKPDGELKRDALWTTADVVGTGLSAVGQFGTGIGAALYTAQMTGQIAAGVGKFTLSGAQTFDDRTGRWDHVFVSDDGGFDPAGFAAIGEIGIDVVQLGMGRGLMAAAKVAGRESSPLIERLTGQRALFGGARTETIAGMKFTRAEDGTIEKARMSFTAAAPSEFVQYLGTRGSAMLSRKSPRDVTPNDLYEAAKRISMNAKTVPTMLINGFGEGTEEGIQTSLEAISHNANIDPNEVWNAYIYGAATGAGMGLGSRIGALSQEDRRYNQDAAVWATMTNGQVLEKTEWKKLTDEQKATLRVWGAQGTVENTAMKEAAKQAMQEQTFQTVKSAPLLSRIHDARMAVEAAELKKALGPNNASFVLSQALDVSIQDHQDQMSLNTLLSTWTRKLDALAEEIKQPPVIAPGATPTPAEQATMDRNARYLPIFNRTLEMRNELQADVEAFYTTTDPVLRQRLIDGINARLDAYWAVPKNKETLPDGTVKVTRDLLNNAAVGLVSLRNPIDNGTSFQWVQPKVSLENSLPIEEGSSVGAGDGVVQVPFGGTQGQGADFDGDRTTFLVSQLMNEDQHLVMLRGDKFLELSGGVGIMTRKVEQYHIELLFEALQLNTASKQLANTAIQEIAGDASELMKRYPRAKALIRALKRDLQNGVPKAKENFLTAMANGTHLVEVQEKSREEDTNEWFVMNRIVQDRLAYFAQAYAESNAAAATKNMEASNVNPVRATGQTGKRRASYAATKTTDLWINSVGDNLFRAWQSLQYTVKRSPIDKLNAEERSMLDQMQRMQLRISSSMYQDKLAEVLSKDAVTQRALSRLRALQTDPEYGLSANGQPLNLLQLAMIQVPDYEQTTQDGEMFIQFLPKITMLQHLLRQAAREEQMKATGIEDDQLARKLNTYLNAEADETLLVVLGSYTMRDLLGIDGDVFGGNLTLDQIAAMLTNETDAARDRDIAAMQLHASYLVRTGRHNFPMAIEDYTGEKGDTYTPYQLVVDALAQYSRGQLSWNLSAPGKVMGRIGEDSGKVGAGFRAGMASLKSSLVDIHKGLKLKSGQSWQEAVDAHPEVATKFLKILPNDVVLASIQTVEGRTVKYQQWIYDMFTLPEAEAEMVLLRQIILNGYRVAMTKVKNKNLENPDEVLDQLKDRWHVLMVDLALHDTQAFNRFHEKLMGSKSVEEFQAYVNNPANGIRRGEAPFTAWHSDIAEIDKSRTEGNLNTVLAGTDLREAMRDFSTMAKNFRKASNERLERRKIDGRVISRLKENTQAGKEARENLERVLEFVRKFRMPLGPGAVMLAASGALYGFSADMTDKGVAAEFVAAMAAYFAQANSPGFMPSEYSLLHSAGSWSTTDMQSNMSWLLNAQTLMDVDGTIIEWDGLTVEKFIELADNEDNWGALTSIMHPSMWEHVGHGRVAQRFATELTFKDLLAGDTLKDLLFTESPHSDAMLVSVLDGLTPQQDTLRLLTKFLVASQSKELNSLSLGKASERTQQGISDLMRLARAALVFAGIDADGPPMQVTERDAEGNKVTRMKGTYKQRTARGNEVVVPGTKLDQFREEFKQLARAQSASKAHGSYKNYQDTLTLLTAELAELTAEAARTGDPADMQRVRDLDALIKETREGNDLHAALLNAWRLPPHTADWLEDTTEQRKRIWRFIREHGMIRQTNRSSGAMSKVFNDNWPREAGTQMPQLNEKEWLELSGVVFTYDMSRRTKNIAAGDSLLQAGDLYGDDVTMFDPSFSYLIDELFDPNKPVMRALIELKGLLLPVQPAISDEQFMRMWKNSGLNPEKFGEWSDAIPAQTQQALQRYDSAGAPIGIAQGGSGPEMMVAIAGGVTRTFEDLEEANLSSVMIFADDLWKEVSADNPVWLTDTKGRRVPMQMLMGRAAKSLWVEDPTRGRIDLLQTARSVPASRYVGNKKAIAQGVNMVTIDVIRTAIREWMTITPGLDPANADKVNVTLDFWHPDDKPVDQQHNLYYDGTVGMSDTSSPSLLAAWWFELGGIDPDTSAFALGANKEGRLALRVPNLLTRQDKRNLTQLWATDGLSNILTNTALELMKQDRVHPGEHLASNVFNAVLKQLKTSWWVRYIDPATNQVELLSADQVIAMQTAGEPLPAGAELFQMPDEQLRTMFDPTANRGTHPATNMPFNLRYGNIRPWSGKVTDEQRKNLPGLFTIAPDGTMAHGDLFNTEVVKRAQQIQISKFSGIRREVLDKYTAGLTVQAEIENTIHRDRLQVANGREIQYNATARDAILYARSPISAAPMQETATQMGLATAGARGSVDQMATALVLDHLASNLRVEGFVAGHVFQFAKYPGRSNASHYIYGVDALLKRNKGKPDANWIAPNDYVTVDLDSLPDGMEDELFRALEFLMSTGSKIILSAQNGNGMLWSAAAKYLKENSYAGVLGSHGVFIQDNPNAMPANKRAIRAHKAETDVKDVRNSVAVWHGFLGMLEENSAIRFDAALGQDVIISNSLLPVNTYASYNIPTADQWDRGNIGPRISTATLPELIKQSLAQVDWTASIYTHDAGARKAEEARITKRLTEAVEKFTTLYQPGVGYPHGMKLEKGDIIPLYENHTGNMILYRYGYKPAARVAKTTLKESVGKQTVIYQPVEDSSATVYEGVLESITPTSGWGAKIEVRTPLAALGDKLQFEYSGFKIVAVAPPASWGLSMTDPLPGVPMGFAISVPDRDSKNNYEGLLDNFRDLMAYLGFDFRDVVAKMVFGQEKDSGDRARQWLINVSNALPKFDQDIVEGLILSDKIGDAAMNALNMMPVMEGQLRGATDWQLDLISRDLDPEQRVFRAMLTYLMMEGSAVDHILSSDGLAATGIRQAGMGVRRAPRIFTALFEQTEQDDPLRAWMVNRLNDRLNREQPAGRTDILGYKLLNTLRMYHSNEQAKFSEEGWLQIADVNPSGNNPVLNLLAAERMDSQALSEQLTAMLFLNTGRVPSIGKGVPKTNALVQGKGLEEIKDTQAFIDMLRGGLASDNPFAVGGPMNRAERHWIYAGSLVNESYRQELDVDRWTKADYAEFDGLRTDMVTQLGLQPEQKFLVDYWLRQILASRKDKDPSGNPGFISFFEAKDAILNVIQRNINQGLFPTAGGMIPHPHFNDVLTLFRAYESKGALSSFKLLRSPGDKSTVAKDLNSWIDIALGTGSDEFDRAFLLDNDSMRHTFMDSGLRFLGIPVTSDEATANILADPATAASLISVFEAQRTGLRNEVIIAQEAQLRDIYGGEVRGLTWFGKEPSKAATANAKSKMWRWRKEGDIPEQVSYKYKDLLKYGFHFRTEGTRQNAALRSVTNVRAALALLTPLLYVGAPVEAQIKSYTRMAASLLAGDGLNRLNGLSPEELQRVSLLYGALGDDQRFKGMVYSEVAMDTHLYNAGRVEAFTSWMARLGGRWQDPYYGMRARTVAKHYVESAVAAISAVGSMTNITPMMVVDNLAANPNWLKKNHLAIHTMAMNTIRDLRNIKATTFALAFRNHLDPLTDSPRLSVATASTLMVKLPYMFASYASNKLVQVAGLQGADAALALMLHGRKKGFFGHASAKLLAAVSGIDEEELIGNDYYDLSEVIESVDITNAVIQSGLTHTGLMAIGMALGGLGLSGEDDEDRRRRRMAKARGFAYLHDPRDIANDFRNADAIFLDKIPFLNAMFQVFPGDEEAGLSARSMATPNWIVKQILSPIVGMERWFNTGNPMEILWGFQDAVGSMPLINAMRFDEAAQTYAELMTEAQELENTGDPRSMPQAYDLIVRGVMNLERMMLESSFANMLYVGWDKYDRDPWLMPDRNAEGDIVTNRLGMPDQSGALTQFVDPKTGEVRTAYKNRDWWDASMHALTENRGTMALLGELFTGFQGDYFRSDMVAKMRKLEKPLVTYQDADAMVRAFWKGGAKPEAMAEVLKGFYIPYDMRTELTNNLKNEIYKAALKEFKGNESKAKFKMNEVWYGPSTNPAVPGLEDIVWSKGMYEGVISYKQSDRYYQLNTTYVQGPDGMPWATGISRNLLQTLGGMAPLQGFNTGTIGGLNVDNRLNSVDQVRGINTGMRSLEKIDDSFKVPVPETGNPAQQFGTTGTPWTTFPKRGGFGGGGGGGSKGYGSKLYAPPGQQAPYTDNEPMINTSNPIIRRTTVRRERTESQKGRLKPWQ